MVSLLRYTASRCALSHIWVPPWVAFVLVVAVSYPSGASASGSISLGVVILLAVSTWIGVATINSESAAQQAALAAVHGGLVRHRLALLLSATSASVVLVPLSTGWAVINDPAGAGLGEVTLAVLAQLVGVLAGVGVAAAVSRPIVNRAAYALLLSILILVVLVVVPGLPPVRSMIEILQATQPRRGALPVAGLTAAATALAVALVGWASARIARRRA